MMEMPDITSKIKGLFSIFKYGIENRNGVFGITFLPYKYNILVSSENDPNNMANKFATIHTSGRRNWYYFNKISKAYNSESPDKVDNMIQNLITTYPELYSIKLI